jgi:hypothetical protein
MVAGLSYGATGARAADIRIDTTKRPTPIRFWGGVAAFSLYDSASNTYRLAISRNAGRSELVEVAAQARAFDVDVGPDESGSATLVYSRCASGVLRPRGCDIYRYSLSARRESKLIDASTRNASEITPTVWGARIAFARLRDSAGRDRRPRIYTRTLNAPRSRPSRRLPLIASRFCRRDGCTVDELELRGRWLALNIRYPGAACPDGQVRLDSLAGRAIRVAAQHCGLNGRQFIGLSFDARNLYFARFCVAAPLDCDRAGAFRYSLNPARYSLAEFGLRLTGFSYDAAGRAFEVLAPDSALGYCGNAAAGPAPPPDCQIVLTYPLTFTPARAPR